MLEVLATHEMKLAGEDDIIAVRRRVRQIAEHRRFDTFAIAAITTATSELALGIVGKAITDVVPATTTPKPAEVSS